MSRYEVQYAQVGDRSIPAYKLVCPGCRKFNLDTTFDTTREPWIAHCSCGHDFEVPMRADA